MDRIEALTKQIDFLLREYDPLQRLRILGSLTSAAFHDLPLSWRHEAIKGYGETLLFIEARLTENFDVPHTTQ